MNVLRELAPSLAGHVAVGVALLGAAWAAGAAWIAQLRRLIPGRATADLVFAYPVGLLLAVAVAWLSTASGAAAAVAAVVALAPLARRSGRAAVAETARAAGGATLKALPFAALFGVALGLYDHGPTASRPSHAFGDLVFWVARTVSTRHGGIVPHSLLDVGSSIPPHEGGPAALGAALHVEPFLFFATTLPVFAVLSLVVCCALLRDAELPSWAAVSLALLLAAAIPYPSNFAEGPPFALALPLGLVLFRLTTLTLPPGRRSAHAVLLGLALAITKPLGVVTLAAWYATAAVGRGWRRAAVALGPPLGVLALLVALTPRATENAVNALELRCYPCTALGHAHTLLHVRSTVNAAGILHIAGEALLVAAVWRARRWQLLTILVAGIAAFWFVSGKGFFIAEALSVIVVAAALTLGGQARGRALVLGAAFAYAVAATFRDTAQLGTAAALMLALVATLYAWQLALPRLGALAAASAVGLALFGAYGFGTYDMTVLPSEYAQVWARVRATTPRDALVFVTQTGKDPSTEAGGNFYPALGERQVFVSGWVYSGIEGTRLKRRLAENSALFAGRAAPAAIREARGHPAYYAVMWTDEPVPKSFGELYANRLFVLYRVPAKQASTQLVRRFFCKGYATCVPLAKPVPFTGKSASQ